MRRFDARRDLETGDRTSLRIQHAEDLADRAVLAGRITALETDQERSLALRVHEILQVTQSLAIDLQLLQDALLGFNRSRVTSVDVVEFERLARPNHELLTIIHDHDLPHRKA